jgi:excisionase family DNA binding protein
MEDSTRQTSIAAPVSPFVTAPEVAMRLRCSLRTVHELARRNEIPLRRLPGCRRLLFSEDDLSQWEAGAAVEVVRLPRGGRIVRPVSSARPNSVR